MKIYKASLMLFYLFKGLNKRMMYKHNEGRDKMEFLDETKRKLIGFCLIVLLLLVIVGLNVFQIFNETGTDVKEENNVVSIKKDTEEKTTEEIVDTKLTKIKVDIKGAVKKPGVYELDSNSIINDVIKVAGGLKSDASTKYLNLSKKVQDEMVINIFTNSEIKKMKQPSTDECVVNTEDLKSCEEAAVIVTKPSTSNNSENTNNENVISDNKVSINTGTLEELMTLSGIGESKAQAIIDYRNKNGNFTKIEDLMNVSGIGETIYNKIKDNLKL